MNSKMIIKYRGIWLFIVCTALVLPVLLFLSISFVLEQRYGFFALSLIVFALISIAIWFRFNYGLKINEKYVVAINQRKIKFIKYDSISYITVKFTNDEVVSIIKTKNQNEYVFDWSGMFLGASVIFPITISIIIDKKFIENSIDSLSNCEKVKILNFYSNQK